MSRSPSEPGLVATRKTIGSGEVHAAIERLAAGILERHQGQKNLILLGIANGGVAVAKRLADHLSSLSPDQRVSVGTVDISFHRDDIGRHPIPKEFAPTHIPADVQGAMVILVDDVLFSGRTVKAALDELFDHGRPTKVELAVLVDRGGHLLPIAADYTGLTVTAAPDERVVVTLDPKNPKLDAVSVLPQSNRKSKI